MYERVVVVTGMPRSGTSWLGEIVHSAPPVRLRVSPPFSWELKNCIAPGAPKAAWDDMLARAYRSSDPFMTQRERRLSGEYPTFADKPDEPPVLAVKFDRFLDLVPEMLAHYPDLRVAAIIRHPCGAIHSWLTAPREFPPDADPLANWRSGAAKKVWPGDFFGFDDWLAMTRMHLELARRHPDRVVLLRYEALVADPVAQARRVFDTLDLPFGAQTRDFLAASHSRGPDTPYAVYKPKSVKDRWRRELQPEIRDAILAELEPGELDAFLDGRDPAPALAEAGR
jgi:hypothetical protein